MPTSNHTTHSVYRIVCFVTGQCYVGQTVNLKNRKTNHFARLNTGKHENKHLLNAFEKYGSASFYFEVLEAGIASDMADEREQYWIAHFDSFQNGYNGTPGGKEGKVVPCTWNGVEYTSVSDAAASNGISLNAMWVRIKKGYVCDHDVPANHKPVFWNGNYYRSINEAAKQNDIRNSTLQARIANGYTGDDEVGNSGYPAIPFIWNGIKYSSIREAARVLGLSKSGLQHRLKRGYTCDSDIPIFRVRKPP